MSRVGGWKVHMCTVRVPAVLVEPGAVLYVLLRTAGATPNPNPDPSPHQKP